MEALGLLNYSCSVYNIKKEINSRILGGHQKKSWPDTTKMIVREFPLWLSRLRTWLVSTRIWVRSLISLSGLRHLSVAASCNTGHRCSLDLVLLWLWHRPALIWPLALTSICCRYCSEKDNNNKMIVQVIRGVWVILLKRGEKKKKRVPGLEDQKLSPKKTPQLSNLNGSDYNAI